LIDGSGERTHDLSADVNVRLWQGPATTNIDDSDEEQEEDEDEDLTHEDLDQMPSNLHDQRLEEDSIAASDEDVEDKPLMAGKPPSSGYPAGSQPQRTEVVDMLPDRPRKSQPIARDEPRQRKPAARTTARRPNGNASKRSDASRFRPSLKNRRPYNFY